MICVEYITFLIYYFQKKITNPKVNAVSFRLNFREKMRYVTTLHQTLTTIATYLPSSGTNFLTGAVSSIF